MAHHNEFDKFFSEKMSLDHLDLKTTDLPLLKVARAKVMSRKKQESEINDLFSLIAAFLNFKIKLYHAVLIAVITGGIILFASKEKRDNTEESHNSEYVSNIAAVRSSTVLSGIYTFGFKQNTI